MRSVVRHFDIFMILSLLIAVPLIGPFLDAGLPNTADAEIHLHRTISALVDINAGYWWPRWSPYLHHGYGYPIHNFYAPGVHIVGALIIKAISADPVQVIKLLQIGATLLYPLGAYFFARRFASRWAALVAAAAYTLAPFRFHELWTQTNLSQFTAMALIPFLFIALLPTSSDRPRRAAWIALLFAAIILAHHPTGFITALVAGPYALVNGWRSARRWSINLGGLLLGLMIASIFLIPALAELQFVKISAVQQGAFRASANLLHPATVIGPIPSVDLARLNTPSFLSIGTPQVLLALLALPTVFIRRFFRTLKIQVVFGAVALVVCVFMMTPSSVWLWDHIPIANLIVYPWRLLGIAAVIVLPGAAAAIDLVPQRWRTLAASGAIAVLFVFALPMRYAPLTLISPQSPTPAGAIHYEGSTGNLGLTSGNEYLPRWAEERPLRVNPSDYETLAWSVGIWDDSLPMDAIVAHSLDCELGSACYSVDSPQSFTLMFKQMYFPGWLVQVDSVAVETYPLGLYGLLSVDLAAGHHNVSLRYGGTSVQHISEALALISLVISTGLILLSLRRTATAVVPEAAQRATFGHTWTALPLVIVFVWIAYDTFTPAVYADIFHPWSTFETVPVQHRVSYVFGGTVELIGYDLDQDNATPGGTLSGAIYWRRIGPIDPMDALRPAIKLTSLNGRQEWGSVVEINLADIPQNRWTLDGYAVEQFTVPISADAPPYLAELRVLVLDGEADLEPLTLIEGGSDAVLTEIHLTGDDRRFNDLMPIDARFGDTINLRGYGLTYPDAGTVCLRVRWQISSVPERDYTFMLHILDVIGEVLEVADAPPLDGLYPSGLWRSGQTLDDERCADRPSGAAVAMIALYDPETLERLPITLTGANLSTQDRTLTIPLAQ